MDWDVNLWIQAVEEAVASFASRAVFALPAILGAIAVFLLGFLVAWIASNLASGVLRLTRLDRLVEKTPLPQAMERMGYRRGMGTLLSKLVYWAVFLVFLAASANIIGLHEVAGVIEKIFGYIPNIVAALIIVIVGAYVARILCDVIVAFFEGTRVAYGHQVAAVARLLVYAFVAVFALEQLGVNTYVLMSNMNIIIAGFCLAFALSFGLGSRNAVKGMIGMYYVGRIAHKGDSVSVGDVSGTIVESTKTGVIIEDSKRRRHYVSGDRIMESLSILP
jgi:hypothetical protein